MPTTPAGDVELIHITGDARPLDDWLTTFHLAVVVLDPYQYESAWLLDTAGRILTTFAGADVRVGFVVSAPPDEARGFLGPWADQLFALCDPEKKLVASMQLESLPALVHIGQDGTLLGATEGWQPREWQVVLDNLAEIMSWKAPDVPPPGAPAPYSGAPAGV